MRVKIRTISMREVHQGRFETGNDLEPPPAPSDGVSMTNYQNNHSVFHSSLGLRAACAAIGVRERGELYAQ
jgi:hypothetical protein